MEEQRQKLRAEMVATARAILGGSIGIVAGARELAGLRFRSRGETDRDILVFVGIDSESSHLPIDRDVRRLWNTEALKAKDDELQHYEARVRERAFRACQSLIARYEPVA